MIRFGNFVSSAFNDATKYLVSKMMKRISLNILGSFYGLEYKGYQELNRKIPMYYFVCIQSHHHTGFNTYKHFKIGDIINIPRYELKKYGFGYEDVNLKYFKKIRNPNV